VGDGKQPRILSSDDLAQIDYVMFGGNVASAVCSISRICERFAVDF
jgi:hypothetical protein